jgi:hypothetical protein
MNHPDMSPFEVIEMSLRERASHQGTVHGCREAFSFVALFSWNFAVTCMGQTPSAMTFEFDVSCFASPFSKTTHQLLSIMCEKSNSHKMPSMHSQG